MPYGYLPSSVMAAWPDLRPSERNVCVGIAAWMPRTGGCSVTYLQIMKSGGLTRRESVRTALRSLENRKIITTATTQNGKKLSFAWVKKTAEKTPPPSPQNRENPTRETSTSTEKPYSLNEGGADENPTRLTSMVTAQPYSQNEYGANPPPSQNEGGTLPDPPRKTSRVTGEPYSFNEGGTRLTRGDPTRLTSTHNIEKPHKPLSPSTTLKGSRNDTRVKTPAGEGGGDLISGLVKKHPRLTDGLRRLGVVVDDDGHSFAKLVREITKRHPSTRGRDIAAWAIWLGERLDGDKIHSPRGMLIASGASAVPKKYLNLVCTTVPSAGQGKLAGDVVECADCGAEFYRFAGRVGGCPRCAISQIPANSVSVAKAI